MSEVAERLTARVTGRVQGVGFRFFTLGVARRLKVHGYSRNLPDGSVEVVAEGPRARLQELAGELRRGPDAARVDGVATGWEAATGEFSDFGVRY